MLKQKIVILDIPLLLENRIDKKKDILIFVQSKKVRNFKKIRERENNFNSKLLRIYLEIFNCRLIIKRKNLIIVIINNFTNVSNVKKDISKNIKRRFYK